MAWTPANPSRHFVQCMAFDDQIQVDPRLLATVIRTYSVFFESIVLNRAFMFNDRDLRSLFANGRQNGLFEVMSAGGVSIIKGSRSLSDDWADMRERAPRTTTGDAEYIHRLSEALDGDDVAARQVWFELEEAAQSF